MSGTLHRSPESEGYYCRSADQVERFFLEGRDWDEAFLAALSRHACEMRDFSAAAILAILKRLDVDVPHDILDKATGAFCQVVTPTI